MKQYRELQMEPLVMGLGVIWSSPTFLKAAARTVEGIYLSTGPTTGRSPELTAFDSEVQKTTGHPALPYEVTGYDHLMLVISAMQKAGSIVKTKVRDTLRGPPPVQPRSSAVKKKETPRMHEHAHGGLDHLSTAGLRLPLGHLPGTRYPDPRVEVLDKRFTARQGNAAIERIATGFRWAEGPVYFADGGYLIWSDIPNNRMMRWLEEDGHVSVFRSDSHHTNGNTRDREGRLVSCEHDTRRVTRTELDGRITVLMDGFSGQKLNGPNDIVVAADGAIWFTDPGYGIDGPYEGHPAPHDLPCNVYRLDPASGTATVVADDFTRPNGLSFSPDERRLYIVDTGITHGGPSHIRVFDVAGIKLKHGRVFAENFAPGMTDGIRNDADGNVWCSMGWADPAEDGVRCYAPDGDMIGKIHLPEGCANLCFGGKKRNRLFMTASTSVYALYLNTSGALRP